MVENEISENDSTTGGKSTATNSLPGTSSSQQNVEEWNVTYSSVSATEDNMAQLPVKGKKKRIIIKLCQPKQVQKLTKVTDASSSLTPNDVRGSSIPRKRTYYQRTLEEISNVVAQAPKPTNSLPLLDLEELTSWGLKKRNVIPQASTFTNSSSHVLEKNAIEIIKENLNPKTTFSNSSPHTSHAFEENENEIYNENLEPQLTFYNSSQHLSHVLEENDFDIKKVSEHIQEILVPSIFLTNSSSHTSRVLAENENEIYNANLHPQVCDSNNSSQETFPLLAWNETYVLPDESTWEKSSSEESSDFMAESTEEEKSYLDWFNKMKTTHTDDWNGFGPRYTEDEIWMDKKRYPNVMWSSAQRPYSEEHFLLMDYHERQKIIKNKEEKYFKERLEYLSQFYAKEEKVPM